MKKLLLLCLFLISFILSAQEVIVDSVYSTQAIDGFIAYHPLSDQYGIARNYSYIIVGDWTSWQTEYPEPNSFSRGYYSFELPEIPEGYELSDAVLRVRTYGAPEGYDSGSGEHVEFPFWNVTNGGYISCIVSHIDYGNDLDPSDWEIGDLDNPNTLNYNIGIIDSLQTDRAEDRFLNIFDSVYQDYYADRNKTQFRLFFEVDTDYDNENDCIRFGADAYNPRNRTIALFEFTKHNSINEVNELKKSFKIYPNPIKLLNSSRSPKSSISYNVKTASNVLVEVFNLQGKKITTLVNEFQNQGSYNYIWNIKNQASGIYLIRIQSDYENLTKKITIIK